MAPIKLPTYTLPQIESIFPKLISRFAHEMLDSTELVNNSPPQMTIKISPILNATPPASRLNPQPAEALPVVTVM
ncbi:Uncharacterised protein [Vibrio cholerae]|nr:Uncharacterised protein [Vibrio cholerae]CSB88113.1 Uncharacterised protein [Vibrio cholerae]